MENTLTFDELTNYLKDVKDLEVSKYNQEEIIKQSNDTLKSRLPVKQDKKPELKELKEPPRANYWISYAIFGLLISIFGVSMESGFVIIVGLVLMFLGFYWHLSGRPSSNDMLEYEIAKQKNKQTYQQELEKYNQQAPLYEKKYSEDMALYEVAKKQVESLDIPLKETTEILNKVYGKDYIFPKYRNMVAMSTIYEYFVTGRVNELTGPNGAYNLYEQELRQNLIINNLETINTQLETIKNNQFTLYTELKKSNETQQKMLGALTEILNNTDSIAASAEISAYCSRITANNSNYNTWFR